MTHSLPLRATYPWTVDIYEYGRLIDSELHRTREAAEEAVDAVELGEWWGYEGLVAHLRPTDEEALPS